MRQLIRHIIVLSLCLAATIAAKIYMDRVLLNGLSPDTVPTGNHPESAQVSVEAAVETSRAGPASAAGVVNQ